MQPKESKTVFVKIWTPDMKHVALVHNACKPDVGNGYPKPEGWGLPGGNQTPEDIENDPDSDHEITDELRTAFREVFEETGIDSDELEIRVSSRDVRPPRAPRHLVVAYDAIYCTDDVTRGLQPGLKNGKIIAARWIPVGDLMSRRIDGLIIHPSHLRIINGEEDTR